MTGPCLSTANCLKAAVRDRPFLAECEGAAALKTAGSRTCDCCGFTVAAAARDADSRAQSDGQQRHVEASMKASRGAGIRAAETEKGYLTCDGAA